MVSLFLEWYALEIPRKIKKIWFNYIWFLSRYFALGQLAIDLFSPWKGLTFKRAKRGFDIGDAFFTLFSNLISRIIGAMMRAFFLVIGLASELTVFCLGLLAFVVWMGLGLIIIYFIGNGIFLLVRG